MAEDIEWYHPGVWKKGKVYGGKWTCCKRKKKKSKGCKERTPPPPPKEPTPEPSTPTPTPTPSPPKEPSVPEPAPLPPTVKAILRKPYFQVHFSTEDVLALWENYENIRVNNKAIGKTIKNPFLHLLPFFGETEDGEDSSFFEFCRMAKIFRHGSLKDKEEYLFGILSMSEPVIDRNCVNLLTLLTMKKKPMDGNTVDKDFFNTLAEDFSQIYGTMSIDQFRAVLKNRPMSAPTNPLKVAPRGLVNQVYPNAGEKPLSAPSLIKL